MDALTEDYNRTSPVSKHDGAVIRMNQLFEFYANQCGGGDESATNLTDLLADLMHWAMATTDDESPEEDPWSIDFDLCVQRARFHFEAEV